MKIAIGIAIYLFVAVPLLSLYCRRMKTHWEAQERETEFAEWDYQQRPYDQLERESQWRVR